MDDFLSELGSAPGAQLDLEELWELRRTIKTYREHEGDHEEVTLTFWERDPTHGAPWRVEARYEDGSSAGYGNPEARPALALAMFHWTPRRRP